MATRPASAILERLQAMANPANVAGMARYGINPQGTLGISIYELRKIAKEVGTDHALALELWQSGIHEARILAAFLDDPRLVSQAQMEAWALDFDSWDVCDQVCSSLFDRTPHAVHMATAWSGRKEEFVKRAGFVLMAALAVHDKSLPDATFETFLEVVEQQADDERNFVKKAVNWALRNIGKRNPALHQAAIAAGRRIQQNPDKTARWVAADALRELYSEKVLKKLARGAA